LIGMTHLGPWDDLAPEPRRWLTRIALGLAVCFLLLSLFLALWRASIIVTDFIPPDLANKFEGIALTFPIPLMLVATALIAWAAVWLIAEAIVYVIRLIAKIADAFEIVLQRLIDALMYPGRVLWNWIASFDRARAIHLQPIRSVETRPLRLAPPEEPPALGES